MTIARARWGSCKIWLNTVILIIWIIWSLSRNMLPLSHAHTTFIHKGRQNPQRNFLVSCFKFFYTVSAHVSDYFLAVLTRSGYREPVPTDQFHWNCTPPPLSILLNNSLISMPAWDFASHSLRRLRPSTARQHHGEEESIYSLGAFHQTRWEFYQ